jgi:PAS domain S-box-containing protein
MEGETVKGEWFCPANGRTYDIITTSVKNARGEVSKLSMLRDMTERTRTEEALRESEARYRGIFETLHDTYYRTDLDDNLIMASPSGERIFGYAVDEAVGRNPREFYVDLADRDRVLKLLGEKGYVRDFEAPLKRRDGSIIWVSSNAQVWRDKDGNIGGVEGITRDITARKTAEVALRQSEQKYRQVVELAHEGVWKFDDAGITTFVNSRMAEMLESSVDEMLGTAVIDFVEASNLK